MKLGWNNLKPKSQYKIFSTSFLTLGILENHVKGLHIFKFLKKKFTSVCLKLDHQIKQSFAFHKLMFCTWGGVSLLFVGPQLWNFLLLGHLSKWLKLLIVCEKNVVSWNCGSYVFWTLRPWICLFLFCYWRIAPSLRNG